MGSYLIAISIFLIGCGARLQNEYSVGGEASIKAEVITRFPDALYCFDALEKGLLTQENFLVCLQELTEGSYTINVGGEITEVIEDLGDDTVDELTDKASEINGAQ